jgi:transcriptional regulator with PAS, ATPase and Fis domain
MQGVFSVDEEPLSIGRGGLRSTQLHDGFMSRQHSVIAREGEQWAITDCDSRNGTAVDAEPITGTVRGSDFKLVRAGETILLLCEDICPFQQAHIELKDDGIIGPRARPLFERLRRAAATGNVHITGETGAGKEIAARAFHEYGPNKCGPYVAVNCAAIPEGVAERLLFGAKKGAFSGATSDVSGYVQEAHGGTLFLDEVGELDLNVQAKLLRVLESGEVLALGASKPQKVDFRVCSATHRDLRQAVSSGKFREDLYYRIGRPSVSMLPLRQRPEEIPYFVDAELRRASSDLQAHASLIELCMLRPWPGNVRELLVEIREAANAAMDAGASMVRASHLSSNAGTAHPVNVASSAQVGESSSGSSMQARGNVLPPRERIEQALRDSGGRVATAARNLGLHRNQLRRWLDKNDVDPQAFSPERTTPTAGDSD